MPHEKLLVSAGDSVLIVVDLQERLSAAMPAAERDLAIANTRLLLTAASRLGVPVLLTEQYPKGLGPTVGPVAEALPAGATRREKTCFSGAALDQSGRSQAILAGMESHVCILQSALELIETGRQVFVVEDACCSRAAPNHANAMERMRAGGVVVTNTESVLFEWLRDARHEHFKAISALLR